MSTLDASLPTSFCRGVDGNPQQGHPEAGGRRLDEYVDTVEAAIQRVLQFAQTTAQQLANTVDDDHDVDDYLRMIFTRGTYLYPFPPANPHFFNLSSPSGESGGSLRRAVTDCFGQFGAAARSSLRREFTEEFSSLTGERKRMVYDLLLTQGAPALEDLTTRSRPSCRARDVDSVFKVIKGLVRPLPSSMYYLNLNNGFQDVIPEVSVWC